MISEDTFSARSAKNGSTYFHSALILHVTAFC